MKDSATVLSLRDISASPSYSLMGSSSGKASPSFATDPSRASSSRGLPIWAILPSSRATIVSAKFVSLSVATDSALDKKG